MQTLPAVRMLGVALALAAVRASGGCDGTTSPRAGATYALVQVDGAPLPAALDGDTIPGTAHYSLVADTLRFDRDAKMITGTTVIREEIVGSGAVPLLQTGQYADTVDLSGNAGTVKGICVPPDAPCQFLVLSITLSGDSLVLDGGLPSMSKTYLRIR